MLLCVLAYAGIGAAPASAMVSEFGSEGEGAGQFEVTRGIAVEQESGDVYVVDRGNRRIDKFTAEGTFLLSWGWGVADGSTSALQTCELQCFKGIAGSGAGQLGGRAQGVAVDNDPLSASHGDVYVEDAGNHRIEKFTANGEFLLMFGKQVNATAHEKGETANEGICPVNPGDQCQEGSEGGEPGEFESLSPNAIAVDPSGNVYVGDANRVQKFSAAGALEGQIALSGVGSILGLAAGAGEDVYVLGELLTGVHEYESSGAEVGSPRPANANSEFNFSSAITLGSGGELFVSAAEAKRVLEYGPGGEELLSMPGLEGTQGMAFGKSGQLYLLPGASVRVVGLPPAGPLLEGEEAVVEPAGTVTVKASINPEGHQTTYRLDYGLEESKETATTPAVMAAEAFEGETVSVKLTGLLPSTTYHFHFVVENSAGSPPPPSDQTFTTLPPVSIDSESVSQVSAKSARLSTLINPLSLPTEYRFEYGPTSAYGTNAPSPDASAGSGVGDQAFSVLLEDLTPGATYHYRVVAHNSLGEVRGADHTFTTQPAGTTGVGLIDGRVWEMVSPPDKRGVALEAITSEGGDIQASEDGSKLAYIAKAPIDSEPAGNRSLAEQQLLATRGSGGWSTQDIATAHEAVAGLRGGALSEYRLFSPDLSSALLEPTGSTRLSELASERTPYRREANGTFVPLVYPGDVPEGTKFGANEESGEVSAGTGVELVSATPDLAHAVIRAPQSLVSGFETGGHKALYEYTAGVPPAVMLQAVSILPNGESAANEGETKLGDEDEDVRNAISSDGSRVVWEANNTHHFYLRDMGRRETIQIDKAQGVAEPASEETQYRTASADGSRVFFTSTGRLTGDSTASEARQEADLYVFEVTSGRGEALAGKLTDLTVEGNPSESANVQGVIGASEGGAYVYFVASGGLLGDAGERGFDLYMVHYDAVKKEWAPPRFIASMTNADSRSWGAGPETKQEANLTKLTSRVSPNGRYLAFMSQRSLTGFDNRDVVSGFPDEEVFLYDAASRRLVCASCDPSGARPAGVLDPGPAEPSLLVDRADTWKEHWLAASIPGWTSIGESALYQSRYLSNAGQLFFDSSVGLVPSDGNGTQDVYEFEPEGIGGCNSETASSSAVFVREVAGSPVDGCVGLISSGTSNGESVFIDASGMGPGGHEAEDVFFLTAARLASSDSDSSLDAYSAHVCPESASCSLESTSVPPVCESTDSCRGPSSPSREPFEAPLSETFSGAGNVLPAVAPKVSVKGLTRAQQLARALKTCRKKKSRGQRASCERQARKRYGATGKAKRSRRSKGSRRA